MIAIIACWALMQLDTSSRPLDAFQANMAAVKVKVSFEFSTGEMEWSQVETGSIWSGADPGFVTKPGSRIVGTWASDGEVQYYSGGKPEGIQTEARSPFANQTGAYRELGFEPRIETLFDGEMLAERFLDPRDPVSTGWISVFRFGSPGFAPSGTGPFSWWEYPFPLYIRCYLSKDPPRTRSAESGGVPTEVEVYQSDVKDGLRRLEVAYDPAAGFLPRRLRQVSTSKGRGYVVETYVVATRPCKAGGFIPTEWYDVSFLLNHFDRDYPSADESTVFTPPTRSVPSRHFRVTAFQDQPESVAMNQVKGVSLVAIGDNITLLEAPERLTLADINRRLGRDQSDQARVSVPIIAASDLNDVTESSNDYAITALICVVALVFLAGAAMLWLRLRHSSARHA